MSLRRSNSNPVLSSAIRRHISNSHQGGMTSLVRVRTTATLVSSTINNSSNISSGLSQQHRSQASRHGHDHNTRQKSSYRATANDDGHQQMFGMTKDATEAVAFALGSSVHIKVPELTESQRALTERERFAQVSDKYGPRGPGGDIQKSLARERNDALTAQQDIDGLPWEVRWKQELMPTPEEIIAEVRDRFELQYQDPMEREQAWYLHWKDRGFELMSDRAIWPQGFTDHLEHYDEFGRRRVLPSDQKWSDSSWKHLADSNYNDRLFFMDTLERKYFNEGFIGKEQVLQKEEAVFGEQAALLRGLQAGTIDVSPDQDIAEIAGTNDNAEKKKVKAAIATYHAKTKHLIGKDLPPEQIDPVTGLIKSGMPPLNSGFTVEEAVLAVTKTIDSVESKLIRAAHAAFEQTQAPVVDVARQQLSMGEKAGGKAIHAAYTQQTLNQIRILKGEEPVDYITSSGTEPKTLQISAASENNNTSTSATERKGVLTKSVGGKFSQLFEAVEKDMVAEQEKELLARQAEIEKAKQQQQEAEKEKKQQQQPTNAEDVECEAQQANSGANTMTTAASPFDGFMPVGKAPAPPKRSHTMTTAPIDKVLGDTKDSDGVYRPPLWYTNLATKTDEYIHTYGMLNDPIETQPPPTLTAEEGENRGGEEEIVGENGTSAFGSPSPPKSKSFFNKPSKPKLTKTDRVGKQGISIFDVSKQAAEAQVPELLSEFKPLPLYREVAKDQRITEKTGVKHTYSPTESAAEAAKNKSAATASSSSSSASDALSVTANSTHRQRRIANERTKRLTLEQELQLPDMAWEADVVSDPNRGVSETDTVPFARENVEKVYKYYRDFFMQSIYEFMALAKSSPKERLTDFLDAKIQTVRKGEIDIHGTEIHPVQLEVIQLLFEANMIRLNADFSENIGNSAETDAWKRKSDDLGKSAMAKAKVLGPSMVGYLSELATSEVNVARKNPFMTNVAHCTDKSFNPITQIYTDWYNASLSPFINATFDDEQQIKRNAEAMEASLKAARGRVRIPDITMEATADRMKTTPKHHQAVNDTFSSWCRGLIHYYTGQHYLRLMRRFASAVFRNRAESEFEFANDYFQAASQTGASLVFTPIPNAEPIAYYDDSHFVVKEGAAETPTVLERSGQLEKAEAAWSAGSTFIWYPIVDETELVLYYERRGMFNNVFSVSERTLDSMNKKTHPSVHPFPERAHKYLEGAPLTRETAEHLWLRYMGQMYREHAEVYGRLMQFETARDLQKKSLAFLYSAVEMAEKSLPLTWKAPLLTKAIYLCHAHSEPEPEKIRRQFADVVGIVDQLYKVHADEVAEFKALKKNAAIGVSSHDKFLSSTAHWFDRTTHLPMRIAVLYNNLTLLTSYVSDEATRRTPYITDEKWEKAAEHKARGEDPKKYIPEIAIFEKNMDEVLETEFLSRIRRWIALEEPNSSSALMLTHLSFSIKAPTSADPAETERNWNRYKPAFDFIYTNVCLGQRKFGDEHITKAIRIMFNMLSASDSDDQKKFLIQQLKDLGDKLPHVVFKDEIIRSVNSLEAHLKDKKKPLYCYMSLIMQQQMRESMDMMTNPDLQVSKGKHAYKSLKDKISEIRGGKGPIVEECDV